MAAVIDAADMSHRVDANESKLRAAALDERNRSAQLMQVLEGVEKTLAHDQQHIHHLEEKQNRTLEEFQQLRDRLLDMQTGPSSLVRQCFAPKSYAARAHLIDRLGVIISVMSHEPEDGDGGDGAKRHDTSLARKPTRRALAFLHLLAWLAAAAFVAVFSLIGSLIAEALVARKANSSLPLRLVKRNKTKRRQGDGYGR